MTLSASNYQIGGTPSTFGSAVLTGLILVTSATPFEASQSAHSVPMIGLRDYNVHQNIGTHSQLQNVFTGDYVRYMGDFESTIVNVYTDLLTKQEPLGKDFEKVLYDSLWDLYVS